MKRIFIFLTLIGTCCLSIGQDGPKDSFGFGLEAQSNWAFHGYQIGSPGGVQVFLKYARHEIYSGCGFYKLSEEKAKSLILEAGYKLHLRALHHWQFFYWDFNFQLGKWSGGTIYNLRYDFVPDINSTEVLYQSVSSIVSISHGFGARIKNLGAFSISAGPGLNFYNQTPAHTGLTLNQNFEKNVCNVVLMVKAILRIEIKK